MWQKCLLRHRSGRRWKVHAWRDSAGRWRQGVHGEPWGFLPNASTAVRSHSSYHSACGVALPWAPSFARLCLVIACDVLLVEGVSMSPGRNKQPLCSMTIWKQHVSESQNACRPSSLKSVLRLAPKCVGLKHYRTVTTMTCLYNLFLQGSTWEANTHWPLTS